MPIERAYYHRVSLLFRSNKMHLSTRVYVLSASLLSAQTAHSSCALCTMISLSVALLVTPA